MPNWITFHDFRKKGIYKGFAKAYYYVSASEKRFIVTTGSIAGGFGSAAAGPAGFAIGYGLVYGSFKGARVIAKTRGIPKHEVEDAINKVYLNTRHLPPNRRKMVTYKALSVIHRFIVTYPEHASLGCDWATVKMAKELDSSFKKWKDVQVYTHLEGLGNRVYVTVEGMPGYLRLDPHIIGHVKYYNKKLPF